MIISKKLVAQSAGAVEYTNYRGVRPLTPTSVLDMTLSDGEVPVMLELWGMWSTPSLPSLPGPLWAGVLVPDRALSIG